VELSTTPIRKVLQQHLFNSKADTLAVAIDLGDVLKDSSKSVCVRKQWYLLISYSNPSTSSVMWTDPQCPAVSALLVETGEAPESIARDLDNLKLAAERDIQTEYTFISCAAQI